MPFRIIPFVLLFVPVLEITVFILMGGQIGVLETLGLILVTAVIGAILLRVQGFQVLARIQTAMAQQQIPGRDLGDGAMILVAGVLLLTPGFVTDSIGFLLFVPFVRRGIWNFLRSRISVQTMGGFAGEGSDGLHGDHAGNPFRHGAEYARGTANAASGKERRPRDRVVDLDPDEFEEMPDDAGKSSTESPNQRSRKGSPWGRIDDK